MVSVCNVPHRLTCMNTLSQQVVLFEEFMELERVDWRIWVTGDGGLEDHTYSGAA